MKHFGSLFEFTRHRNEDIMRVYRDCVAKANHIFRPSIIREVAESPASRFWVSEERATLVITQMLRDPDNWDVYKYRGTMRMRAAKREMFEEIFRRFLKEREKHPELTIADTVAIVVHQPAPKFYLTPRTVGELIYRIKNGFYD